MLPDRPPVSRDLPRADELSIALNLGGVDLGFAHGHQFGGGATVQKKAYDCVSCLNRKHMHFAWMSLVSVGFTDLYVRLCSMGIWTDWRIL